MFLAPILFSASTTAEAAVTTGTPKEDAMLAIVSFSRSRPARYEAPVQPKAIADKGALAN
jgi:hypothetical protein